MHPSKFNIDKLSNYDKYIKFSWANYIEQQIIAGLSKEEAKLQANRAEMDLKKHKRTNI